MSDEIEEAKKPLKNRIVNWIVGIGSTFLVSGGIGGTFWYSAIETEVVQWMVDKLQVEGIIAMPKHLMPLMLDADQELARLDSTLERFENIHQYQQEVNLLFLTNCDTIRKDGLLLYKDPCEDILWTVQNGYIYQAVKQGRAWYYYPFQWQLGKGDDNHVRIE